MLLYDVCWGVTDLTAKVESTDLTELDLRDLALSPETYVEIEVDAAISWRGSKHPPSIDIICMEVNGSMVVIDRRHPVYQAVKEMANERWSDRYMFNEED